MSTEEKIKQAFERQAGRAGDHRKVLAEVRKATAKRRIGGWGTGLISIGVAAAVATPIILVSTGQPHVAVPADPTVSTLPAAPVPPKPAEHASEGATVLQYQPGWLPEGSYENARAFHGQGMLTRTWVLPDSETTRQRELMLAVDQLSMPAQGRTVDINGIPGMLVTDHQNTVVAWMAEPGQRISLTIMGTDEVTNIALRVARSVKPDGDAAFVWPLEFTWLPQHLQPSGFSVFGTNPEQVDVGATAQTIPPTLQQGVSVNIRSRDPREGPPRGEPVTVRGKQGLFISGELSVELEPGRWLEVRGPLSQQDLVNIADGIRIGPLRYPWIGTR